MFIVCQKEKNIVFGFGENLSYLDNGYIWLVDEDRAWPNTDSYVVEIETIPEYVKIEKYCYTEEKGFYVNPDYVEPDPTNTYGIPDDLFNQIKADYREQLASEVTENGYNS